MKLLPAHPTSPLLLLLLPLALLAASCATQKPQAPRAPLTGDPLADNQTQLAAAPAQDKPLWQYRLAATALRQDRPDIAKTNLDATLATPPAKSAPGQLFHGDTYERLMANYYRSLLYWADGDLENARARLRDAQHLGNAPPTLAAATAKTEASACILPNYLEGLLSAKLALQNSDAGAAALARARHAATAQNRPPLPNYDPAANVFIFVDYGDGPLKYINDKGETCAYTLDQYPCQLAKLRISGQTIELPPYDDIGFQAITRGSQPLNKPQIRDLLASPLKVTGDALLKVGKVFAGIAMLPLLANNPGNGVPGPGTSHGDSNGNAFGYFVFMGAAGGVAIVFVGASLPFHAASNAFSKKPQLDTRCWDNLPRYLSFAALKLPPGAHEAELTFHDSLGRKYITLTQHFTVTVPDPAALPSGARPKDVVIYRSQLRN